MEAKVASKHHSSILVPSVQEMVKEKMITTVPPRYVRSDLHKAEIDGDLKTEIPIIDLNRLCTSTSMDSEIDKLWLAKNGDFSRQVSKVKLNYFKTQFFTNQLLFYYIINIDSNLVVVTCLYDDLQLVNHGMDSGFLDKFKSDIHDFFNLPMEEKKKLWQKPQDFEGFGQAFVVSDKQKLDWADTFHLTLQPARLRNPHLFPKIPLPLRDTLETYSAEMKSIAKILFAKMAVALKINPEEMENLFDDDLGQIMRMNYYPPCPEPDQVIGLTPHSDSTGVTILLQVNEVEGLQIKKDGMWVSVKPLPNAFVVNVGDMIEIITNGTYRSIEHRGVVNSEKERLSLATFHNMGTGKEVGPLRSLVERQKVAYFRSMTTDEYFKGLFSRELGPKDYLDVMRI